MEFPDSYEQDSLETGPLATEPSRSNQPRNGDYRNSLPLYQQIWAELSELKTSKRSDNSIKWKIQRKIFRSFDLAGMALQKLLVAYMLTLSDKPASAKSLQATQTIIVLSGSFLLMISNIHGKTFFLLRLLITVLCLALGTAGILLSVSLLKRGQTDFTIGPSLCNSLADIMLAIMFLALRKHWPFERSIHHDM